MFESFFKHHSKIKEGTRMVKIGCKKSCQYNKARNNIMRN
jgi:hypothetical protein